MVMMGMDPDVVEGIGANLQNQAQAVQSVISAVDGLIGQAEAAWKGADADQFRDAWNSQYKPALNQMNAALTDLGTAAKNNAANQRATSQG